MDKKKWKSTIKKCTVMVGTYNKAFDPIIDTLADILAKRDQAEELYQDEGAEPTEVHTNKAGANNREINPLLKIINDLNRDALAYWRDLGLTPAGLKKINEEAIKEKKASSLDTILSKLG